MRVDIDTKNSEIMYALLRAGEDLDADQIASLILRADAAGCRCLEIHPPSGLSEAWCIRSGEWIRTFPLDMTHPRV